MPVSLYDVSVPLYIRYLGNLAGLLDKARSFADEQGLSHSELLEARLYPDMHPLVKQIQLASDASKFTAVRAGQVENVAMEDNETSFDDLQVRIARTIDFLKAVPPGCMDGREDAAIVLKLPNNTFTFTGRDYVLGFCLPNFYFHVTAAYAILRHKGVPLGKRDFLKI